MRSRAKLSQLWVSLLLMFGLVAAAGPVGATPIHRVPGLSHHARAVSLGVPGVYGHSFLGLGPLSGEVVPRHVPHGRALGSHRHHDGGLASTPPVDPPVPAADMTPDDTTQDNTSPAIPEPSAALLFGAGSLLVSSALRRRKPVA